jgi:hypothetical protein
MRRDFAEVDGAKRLFRHDAKACVVAEGPLECGKVGADFRPDPGLLQQSARYRCVAAQRSEDKNS